MKTAFRRMLYLSFIVEVLLIVLMVENEALVATVHLNDIDSGLASPTGNYRWLDMTDQAYNNYYRSTYIYYQAIHFSIVFDIPRPPIHSAHHREHGTCSIITRFGIPITPIWEPTTAIVALFDHRFIPMDKKQKTPCNHRDGDKKKLHLNNEVYPVTQLKKGE